MLLILVSCGEGIFQLPFALDLLPACHVVRKQKDGNNNADGIFKPKRVLGYITEYELSVGVIVKKKLTVSQGPFLFIRGCIYDQIALGSLPLLIASNIVGYFSFDFYKL